MDRPNAEALVDYDLNNISKIRKDLLENISSITTNIPGYDWLNDSHSILSGENSPLFKLNKTLSECIITLSKVLRDSSTSLENINTCKKLMGEVHTSIEEWTKLEIYKKLVPEVFPFSIQAGEKDDESLNAAKKTLEISNFRLSSVQKVVFYRFHTP